MKKFTLLICLFISNIAIAQITVGPGVVNRYYKVTGIYGTSVNVGSSQGASHTLSAGDKVILMQMTGSTNNNAGKFEFADVVSVSGGSVQLSKIDRNYSVSSNVQLVWVPSNPSGIVVNGTIRARPYNGGLGGVVSVFTHGTLTLNGNISANHAGFRYGQTTISGKVYHGGGGGGGHGGGGGGGGYGEGGEGGYSVSGDPSPNGGDGEYNGGSGARYINK